MDKFIVRKIRDLKKIRPDTSWLESQRSFLLSEISQTQNQEKKPSLILPLFNFNILKLLKPSFAIALAIIVLVSSLGTIGVISAAQNSLPGDFLYPVKTAFEDTQMTLTPSEEGKAKLSIKLATHRIDEFTQLIDKPDKKKDIEETVQKFTKQMISVQQEMDKLKQKNAEKAAEVAKLVRAQASVYEEALIEAGEQLAYIIPEDKEEIKKGIDKALEEVNKIEEMTEGLVPENNEQGTMNNEQSNPEEIIVPAENVEKAVESSSFENLQPKEVE